MKILRNSEALALALLVVSSSAWFVPTTRAQSNFIADIPAASNAPSATPMDTGKADAARKLMTMFYAKWDSDTWEKIRKLLDESPSLIQERMNIFRISLLHRASTEGNLAAAEWLIAHGVDVNIKDDTGTTPLFVVQDVNTARWLLEHGADVNATNSAGRSPLYGILASPLWFHPEKGDGQRLESENIASLLMANGADTNLTDNAGNDYLHALAMGEHYQWLKDNLRNGANPNTKNKAGQGIWFVPIMKKQDDVVDWLENHGVKYDPQDEELVKAVMASGNTHIMKKLQKKGFDVNKEDSKTGLALLETAIVSGNKNAFDMLLECGARGIGTNRVYNSQSLMRSAVKNVEFVKYLLTQGCDVNAKDPAGHTLLFSAILVSPTGVVEFLLNNGADKNRESAVDSDAFGWVDAANHKIVRLKSVTPLIQAACGFRKDVLETLLAHGVDVNARTTEGYTALAVAEKKHNKKLADLLRQNGGVK